MDHLYICVIAAIVSRWRHQGRLWYW